MARSIDYGRVVFWCGLLALAAVAGGCHRGPTWNLAPVEGTITKGGQPLAGVKVIFWPEAESGTQGPRTCGGTDEAGHYRLRTDAGDWGAALGHYRVCIVDPPAEPEIPEEQRRVPLRYGSFTETPLRAEVQPGAQVIDLDVK